MRVSMSMHPVLIQNLAGIHYAVRIMIGTALLLFIFRFLEAASPLWAVISLIIVTEPQMRLAWLAFRSRIINTFMGSLVGLAVIAMTGPAFWPLVPAIAFTALLSTYIDKAQQGWRLAPITTAIVLFGGMTARSTAGAMEIALSRSMEVFLGSAIALLVTVAMSRLWLPPEPAGETEKK